MLIGVLGKDAETTFTTSNVAVTKFSVATTHSKKKGETWENITTWHNCTAFSLNDFTTDKLKKGAKVYVEGRIDHQTYEKDGQTKHFTQIIVNGFDGIIILDKKDTVQGSQAENQTETKPEIREEADENLPF